MTRQLNYRLHAIVITILASVTLLCSSNFSYAEGSELFFEAEFVKSAAPEQYADIVADGGDLYATGPDQRTTLHYAIRYGSVALVEYLIKSGVDINQPNAFLNYPIHWSVSAWNDGAPASIVSEKLRILLAEGANVNALTDRGETPIMFAGTIEIAQFLLDNGADSKIETHDGIAAIEYHVRSGRPDVADHIRSKVVEAQPSSEPVESELYTAILSCGMNGGHMNIVPCFDGTELKVEDGNRSTVYQIYNIGSAGKEYQDGLHIPLSSSFELIAQNGHDVLVLEVKIKDANGKVVFQDQAGRFGVIRVGN